MGRCSRSPEAADSPAGPIRRWRSRCFDLRREVDELRARGVAFEEYDLPTIKTVDNVARMPAGQAAWFRDPDGNRSA